MLKEKSWELARAQARIEQLEGDLANSDQQFRQLERAKQRETSCREECERRLCILQVDNHRQLSSAKDALQQAREALTDARDGMRQQQSCGGAGSSMVQSARASSECRSSSLRTCCSEATCTSLGATPQMGMSSSHTSLSVVQRGTSMLLGNRGSVGSATRTPAKKNGPKALPPHCPSTFPATVTTANRRRHACEGRLVDCKQDCQRQEALSTTGARRPCRWPPA